jgi:hypothetical protein
MPAEPSADRSAALHVERVPTAAALLAAATPFLVAHEAQHGLMLGVAGDAAAAGTPIAYAAVVRDAAEGGTVVGAALRTHEILVVARGGAPGVAAALARDAVRADVPPPPVARALVPAESADAFAAASGVVWRTVRREGIHELRAVVPPRPVPGAMRAAGTADRDTLVDWTIAFREEASGEPSVRDAVERAVDARLPVGALHVWDVDGHPVASAAWAGATPHGIRVNFVYTPPPLRGRGYASALVAALSQRLLDGGRALVFLHTDLANPTANGVYRRIGYRLVAEARLLARG